MEKGGKRTFVSYHGIEYRFDADWMAPHANKSFDYGYFCGLEVAEETGGALVEYLQSADIQTLFYAPGPRGDRIDSALTAKILSMGVALHLNDREVLSLGASDDLQQAARNLWEKTRNLVIVTRGEAGVFWLDEAGAPHTLPGESATVVDTIGAGDSHIGATLLGLSRGLPLTEALSLANRVAAAVVSTAGPTLDEEAFARVVN